MEYSTTQGTNIAAIVGVIVLILSKFGINIATEEITQVLGAIIAIVAIITNWVNRYKKGDLTLGGFRK